MFGLLKAGSGGGGGGGDTVGGVTVGAPPPPPPEQPARTHARLGSATAIATHFFTVHLSKFYLFT